MRDTTRRRMIQLSGGIALAGMAGCLGNNDDDGDDNETDGGSEDGNSSDGDGSDGGAETGDDAPDLDLETPDGESVELKPVDKPTVVLFADVTSEEGKTHSETLVDIYEEYGEYARLITVNSDLEASKDDLREFHEEYGGDWEHAMGTAEVIEEYGIDATVTVCVVDEDGELAFRFDGEVTESAIEEAVETYTDD